MAQPDLKLPTRQVKSRCLPVLIGVLWMAVTAITAASAIDNDSLRAEADGRDWAAYGRSFSEQHYSPLKQLNARNVKRLGLAWSMDLNGIANTSSVPLAVDGVIYMAVGHSLVHAVDARAGRLLWRYDPEVAKVARHKLRLAWGIRGLAFWNDKVIVGTQDGRLIALDAKTGALKWSTMTVDPDDDRYITGAPRVFNGKVIIGHGGADIGATRGYVTTYDAETGKQLWRFFIVPGNPAEGFENKAMEMAAKTWTGEWWKFGGGGAAWNAITYDPEFNRVYVGTGNGSPWNAKIRSPGGGDNLFLCSVLALDADSGEYVWHYQTNPAESWDYNSTMDIELATIMIDGKPRQVILHAPKNGFFYVIDRSDGRLISAEKFTKVSWAERIDLASGRPVEAPGIRYENADTVILPGPNGGHNWQPMSYSPMTGLAYIPTMSMAAPMSDKGIARAQWHPVAHVPSAGMSSDPLAHADAATSALVAWDPVAQRAAWKVATPGLWNSGTMATAGNLVFQGQADGKFNAYAADSGRVLWSFNAGNGMNAAPITFLAGGRQYVAMLTGVGSAAGAYGNSVAQFGWQAHVHPRRLLVFALGAKARLPKAPPAAAAKPIIDASFQVDPAKATRGALAYAMNCFLCHGRDAVGGGSAPDLRASPIPLSAQAFAQIVREGAPTLPMMPRFPELSDDDLDSIRHYLRAQARAVTPTQTEH